VIYCASLGCPSVTVRWCHTSWRQRGRPIGDSGPALLGDVLRSSGFGESYTQAASAETRVRESSGRSSKGIRRLPPPFCDWSSSNVFSDSSAATLEPTWNCSARPAWNAATGAVGTRAHTRVDHRQCPVFAWDDRRVALFLLTWSLFNSGGISGRRFGPRSRATEPWESPSPTAPSPPPQP